jgi:hypothetical protein
MEGIGFFFIFIPLLGKFPYGAMKLMQTKKISEKFWSHVVTDKCLVFQANPWDMAFVLTPTGRNKTQPYQ